jgi:hypothetical protein
MKDKKFYPSLNDLKNQNQGSQNAKFFFKKDIE